MEQCKPEQINEHLWRCPVCGHEAPMMFYHPCGLDQLVEERAKVIEQAETPEKKLGLRKPNCGPCGRRRSPEDLTKRNEALRKAEVLRREAIRNKLAK